MAKETVTIAHVTAIVCAEQGSIDDARANQLYDRIVDVVAEYRDIEAELVHNVD